MGTQTTNYTLEKPTIGGANDTWGDEAPGVGLNENMNLIDTQMKVNADAAAAAQATADAIIAAIYPIGTLYMSTLATNPATLLGVGTWVEYASGRALVGVGFNGESTWGAAEGRGSEVHTLTAVELATHSHSVDPPATLTTAVGDHSHVVQGQILDGLNGVATGTRPQGDNTPGYQSSPDTDPAGAHDHTVDIASFGSGATGSGTPHANIQPSLSIYVWLRSA